MKKAFESLSQEQFDFIEKEIGKTHENVAAMTESEISDLYDAICDIEVEMTIDAGDGELSERGKIAESIVTIVGNSIMEETKKDNSNARVVA